MMVRLLQQPHIQDTLRIQQHVVNWDAVNEIERECGLPETPCPQSDVTRRLGLADYRIEQHGHAVIILTDRARQRDTRPRPVRGWRIPFQTQHETAEFVLAGEAEGFTFEGKELIADARQKQK